MTDDPDDPLLRPASDAGWDDKPAGPAVAKAEEAKRAEAKPVEAKLAEPNAKLAEAKPVDAKPVEADAKPADADANAVEADAKPVEADAKPVEADAKTADTDAKPADAKPATSASPGDEPLLPAKYDVNDLRAAVGASPLAEPIVPRTRRAPIVPDDDDDATITPRNRKAILIAVLAGVGALGIAALIFVGRVNSDRYLLACEAERAVPEQGRSFPPWGLRPLDGEPWRPLKITAETRCQPHETDDVTTLQRLYLEMILDQATAILSAREVTRTDDAEALLRQALLLTRPPEHESDTLAAERNERHKDVERMLGDVTYWRASAKLREATAALGEAAKQFESAAAQHPRHVSDASAWASYARKLAVELHAGPAGTPPPAPHATPSATAPPAAADRDPISPGIALPVEPERPAPAAQPAAPPPDAGPPTGGVLL